MDNDAGSPVYFKKITVKPDDERWLRLLFGEPYEAKFQSEIDQNDDILGTDQNEGYR